MYEGYTLVFDIDGTLCPIRGEGERYEDLAPFPEMVERLRECRADGARIVLYTSRNMNTYGGNIGLINKHTAAVLSRWLERWDIPYDEIVYGKVWPGKRGFYVDDRTVRPDEFLSHTPEELEEICRASRCAAHSQPAAEVAAGGCGDGSPAPGGEGCEPGKPAAEAAEGGCGGGRPATGGGDSGDGRGTPGAGEGSAEARGREGGWHGAD